jgi:uncharacterized protein YacL
MSIEFVFRLVGMVVFATIGVQIAELFRVSETDQFRITTALTLSFAALGLLAAPWLTTRPFAWLRRQIRQMPASQLLAAVLGLAVGLGIAALLAPPLSGLPEPFSQLLPVFVSVLFGYLGIAVMVMRQRDIVNVIGASWAGVGVSRARGTRSAPSDEVFLLDTSVVIDGRISDISQTGFIRGTMLIPRFILNELQHIADSPDTLRRNRGRRGLDMLNRLQKESVTPIRITDMDIDQVREVDDKLVMLAKQLRCPIITNDFNLNRVAELQGITVLNINELANAVKAVILPGETMEVRLIQEGKEIGQGVGYLDDGTMIVVENGRRHLNQQVPVTVTKVLQTAAGRMIFARLEN